ncbi:MAG: hypothetical protein Q8T11_04045 [Elusimicrobiota bacterium]|nr:hypothetical protein [Elusimicrobiota bacterium]
MIPSYLRRALLVLAVIALAIARASARTGSDAAFSSALAEGAPVPAQFAALKAKPRKPAAPPAAPSAPEAVWQKVLETVKRDAEYAPGAGPMPSVFSIEDSTGDPKGEHVKQGITVLGMINDEDQFVAVGVILIFGESKLNAKDGNYHVEQWMFQTDVYGDVGEAAHGVVIMSPDGKPLGSKRSPLDPADPKIQKQYDAMLKHWAERTPKGA